MNARTKIGAAPLTMACLTDPKVRQHLGNADDDTKNLMRDLQDYNDLSIFKNNSTRVLWKNDQRAFRESAGNRTHHCQSL